MEVDEAVEQLANDDVDSKIVRMLRLGYTPADIARDLGIHKGNVSRRINRIRQTYMELINE
jgi:DNA-directed RNA polymerase specialized sigma24 family protein